MKDEDPYVRKTACTCVAKLFNTSPQMVRESDLITTLLSKLEDGNAIVVANALAALNEISILSGENEIKIRSKTLKRILLALNESNEWGQVYILDSLISYTPKKEKSAELIIESVLPRLAHANPSVVMSAIKVVLKFLDWIESPESVRNYCKKVSNSLMTIMSAGPEIQYVLLRSLHAIVQKRPYLLDKDFKHFYVKYNDPIYVKLEKIDILYKLADAKNFENILNELKSYAITEFDPDIIKRAIRYLGYIGYKFEKSLDLCVESVKEILEHSQEFGISEAIIVARDLMRKYKGKSLEIIKRIDEDLIKSIDDSEGKGALLYILGEFCNNVKNSVTLLTPFVENFNDETPSVKLQILNCVIKNYVNKPNDCEELVKVCLQKGGEESENPDVRDRAYIYWRLLEKDPDVAKEMISGEKPAFEFKEELLFEDTLIDNIIENMTNISGVYHKPGKELIPKEDMIIEETEESEEKKAKEEEKQKDEKTTTTTKKSPKKSKIVVESNVNINDADLLGLDEDNPNAQTNYNFGSSMGGTSPNLMNIMDIFGSSQQVQNTNNTNNSPNDFFNLNTNNNFGGNNFVGDSNNNFSINNNQNDSDFNFVYPEDTSNKSQEVDIKKIKIFNEQTCNMKIQAPQLALNKNLLIYSTFNRENGKAVLGLFIKNKSSQTYSNFVLDSLQNSFSLGFENPRINAGKTLSPNSSDYFYFNINVDQTKNEKIPPSFPYSINLRLVVNNGEIFDFNVPILINCLLVENGKISTQNFVEYFKTNNNNSFNVNYFINNIPQNLTVEDNLNSKLEKNNIFLVAKQNKTDPPTTFYSCNVLNNLPVIIECFCPRQNPPVMKVKIIGSASPIIPLIKEVVDNILS